MTPHALPHDSSSSTVLVIGPSPDQVGGMASVVGQTLGMTFHGRYRAELLPITLSPAAKESKPAGFARHVRQVWRLRRAVRRARARIVHIHTCSGFSFYRAALDMVTAQRLGCRVILHIHGAKFDVFHDSEPPWRRRLIAWSLARADRVVALSAGWREKLGEMAPEARLVVVENAVEIPVEPPQAPARRPPETPDNGACRFVLLARMDDWKGIDDLLTACTLLCRKGVSFDLTLAGPPGTAGDAGELKRKILNHGVEATVRYVGPVHGEAKSMLLKSADVCVQPSHHEGMPLALLEALAYGLPVVATRVGGVPEVLNDGHTGVLLPPHRPDLLAGAMRELASNDVLRRSMSRAARALAIARFSTTRLNNDLCSLYDSVMDSGAPSSQVPRLRHARHMSELEHFPVSYAASPALRDTSNDKKPRGAKPAARDTETGNALIR